MVAIQVDEANNTVLVTTRADVTLLFPRIAPQLLIQRTGVAQVRLTTPLNRPAVALDRPQPILLRRGLCRRFKRGGCRCWIAFALLVRRGLLQFFVLQSKVNGSARDDQVR